VLQQAVHSCEGFQNSPRQVAVLWRNESDA